MKKSGYVYFIIVLYFIFFSINVYAFDASHITQEYGNLGDTCSSHNGDGFVGIGKNNYYSIQASSIPSSGETESRLMYAIDGVKVSNNKLTVEGWAYVNGMMNIAMDGDPSYCYNVIDDISGCRTKVYVGSKLAAKCVRPRWGSLGDRNISYKFRLYEESTNTSVEFNSIEYKATNNDLYYFQAKKSGTRGFGTLSDGEGAVMWFSSGKTLAAHYRGKYVATLSDLDTKLTDGEYTLQIQIYAYNVPGNNPNTQYVFKTGGGNSHSGSWVNVSERTKNETWTNIGVYTDFDKKVKFEDKTVIKTIKNNGQEDNKGSITTGNWQGINHYFWKLSGNNIDKTGTRVYDGKTYSSEAGTLKGFKSASELDGYTFSQAHGAKGDVYIVNSSNYIIPASWVKFDSSTKFIIFNDNKNDDISVPSEQNCDAGYDEVAKKKFYPVRKFKNDEHAGEYEYWKNICNNLTNGTAAESLYYSVSDTIDGIDSTVYDLDTLKVVRGQTIVATNETEFYALRSSTGEFMYGGKDEQPIVTVPTSSSTTPIHRVNTMVLGFFGAPNSGIDVTLRPDSKLKIKFYPLLKSSSKFIGTESICKSSLPNKVNLSESNYNEAYFPFETTVKFCAKKKNTHIPDPPVCEDNAEAAKCNTEENKKGTAYYHENDKYQTCLLKEQEDSGFKLVKDKNDTKSEAIKSSRYCVVACKDNIDVELPNLKETFVGSYFNLTLDKEDVNNIENVPTVNIRRNCMSSKIKIEGNEAGYFKYDVKVQSDKVYSAYNIWKDYEHIYNEINDIDTKSDSVTTCTNVTCPSGGECHESSYSFNSIPVINGASKSSDVQDFGEKTESEVKPGACAETKDTSFADQKKAELLDEYNTKKTEAESRYENEKEELNNIISEMNDCHLLINGSNESPSNGVNSEYALFKDDSPKINYNYDDIEHEKASGDMKAEEIVDLSYIKFSDDESIYSEDSGALNINIQNDIFTGEEEPNGGRSNSNASYSYVECNEESTNCNEKNNTEVIYNQTGYLKDTRFYLRSIQQKKWSYTTATNGSVFVYKDGTFSTTDLGNAFKLFGQNPSPISMRTRANIGLGYNYSLEYSSLDDNIRQINTNGKENQQLSTKTAKDMFNEDNKFVCKYKVYSDGNDGGKNDDNTTIPDDGKNRSNFFYRTIDVRNINPNARSLGYNWDDSQNPNARTIKDFISETYGYANLTNRDHITFTLTPNQMRAIREGYNSDISFTAATDGAGNRTMICENQDNEKQSYCRSVFLNCLAGDGNCGIDLDINDSEIVNSDDLDAMRYIIKNKNNDYIN